MRNFSFTLLTLSVAFLSCSREKNQELTSTVSPDSIYLKQGNEIVAQTFDTLRNSLLRAIGEKGIEHAIGFCNDQARVLTHVYADSIAIRRISLRFRNPNNQPDSVEFEILQAMETTKSSGGTPEVRLVRNEQSGEIHFFKPILFQPMCLSCHGKPNADIQPQTLSAIQKIYPADRAIDFKVGDLRGMWHVVFKEPTN